MEYFNGRFKGEKSTIDLYQTEIIILCFTDDSDQSDGNGMPGWPT